MIFNGDTNGNDIVTLTNDLLGVNNITFPLAEKARSASRVSRRIWAMIFESYGGWQYDDINNTTDFPRARGNLVVGQKDYSLPLDLSVIRNVEILSGEVWQNLNPITEEEILEMGTNEAEFHKVNGTPIYYQPIGSSIKLYPAPDQSVTQGIRISYDRDIVTFLATDTTKTPGWNVMFHEMLAVGMALDFLVKNPSPQTQVMRDEYERYSKDLKRYYLARFKEKYPLKLKVIDSTRLYM
jgi:hypothetical protein